MGYPVRALPLAAWTDTIARHVAEDPQHPMTPYIPMLTEPPEDTGVSLSDIYFGNTLPAFDHHNTDRVSARSGRTCPPVDGRLIDLYLRRFQRTGFLAPPPTHADVD
ncbi:hypothetical protein [Embleya sp. NPDC020630]|uniref:hypothetical protein n=1 Tax=Embleya sp. NPDC020630 TaxID=3363979 RepID=UPI00379A3B0C